MRKHMSQRIVSFLLTIIMVVFLFPLPETKVSAAPTIESIISVDNDVAVAGGKAVVNINLKNNPGITALRISVSYDDNLLKLEEITYNADMGGQTVSPENLEAVTSPVILYWTDGFNDYVEDGVFATLTFSVSESAEIGACSEIIVTYDAEDIYNANETNVPFAVQNGEISIIAKVAGDINGDGVCNAKDTTRLMRYLAGWDVEVNASALDMNGDGLCNAKDTTRLMRYLAGWDVEVYIDGVVVEKCDHIMKHIPYKAATCTQEGNAEYYHCTTCGKYFNNSNGTKEITPVILPATGHSAVTDPYVEPTTDSYGWTEGSHCSTCGEILVAQEKIPMLEKAEYVITYKLPSTDTYLKEINAEASNTNPKTYTTDEGIEELVDLEIPGYDFFGWYTEPKGGGLRVSSIPVGTTGKKTLHAYMEAHVYTIDFDTPDVDVTGTKITGEPILNKTEYTVDKGATLKAPTQYGYSFTGWSNNDGYIVSHITPGTTGNMTLHANWTANRNKAVSYQSYDDPIIIEDDINGQLLFVYNIGKIENVPLNVMEGSEFYNPGTKVFTKDLKITNSVDETLVSTINNMVANATTKSSGWTLEEDWNDLYTSTESVGSLREKTEERTTSDGTVIGEKYFISNSKSGSTYISDESGGSTTNTTKVTTDKSMGINASYDKSTEKYCDAQLGIKTHLGGSNTLEAEAGVDVLIPAGIASAGVKNTTTVEGSIDGEAGIQNGRKDNTAFHIDGSYSEYVGTVDTTADNEYYNTTVNASSSWNSQNGYEQSREFLHEEKVTDAIKEQLSETTTHSVSKALGGTNSQTVGNEETLTNASEYGTSMTYDASSSTTTNEHVEETFTISGYYRYITAGTIHVYGVVGYDIATASYYTHCFNVLDDRTYQTWDYSMKDGTFIDCENGVVTFEIPFEVNQYVAGMLGRTNGLEISYDGVVTGFEPTEDFNGTVVIPQYERKDNLDNKTYSAVKVKSFSSETFAEVKEQVKVVVLPTYITEIPDNAFANCTNLETVIAYGVTKIGENAFAGCTSLKKFYVDNAIISLGANAFENVPEVAITAYDSTVADAAINCGAKNISLNIAYIKDSFEHKDVVVPSSTGYFTLIGNGGVYNNVSIKSNAVKETMINNMVFANNTGTPIEIASEKVTLARMTVQNAPGFAVVLKADNVQLNLLGDINLSSIGDNAVISKSVSLKKADAGTTSKLILDGNYLTCGNITNPSMLTFTNGKIVELTETEYETMLTSGVVTFDPNGGIVDVTTKQIYYDQPYGELPTPTRVGYIFDGWYSAKIGGAKITADTKANVLANQVLYAQWSAMSYKVSWDTGSGYTIIVDRITSPYANAEIGTLNNGADIYYGDELAITYTAKDGYTLSVTGTTSITVTEDVTSSTIFATASLNAYTINWNVGAGYSITVNRIDSPVEDALIGELSIGDEIYYGDILEISYSVEPGYVLESSGLTSIVVAGNVTSNDIYALVKANSYTYNIIYKSSNGTDLGNTTEIYEHGTTHTIYARAIAGYDTPGAQTITCDTTGEKTITFIYTPTNLYFAQDMSSGDWNVWGANNKYGVVYGAYTEFQNRTANSIEIRVVWQNTLKVDNAYAMYGYNQYFSASIGGHSTGNVLITSAGTWSGAQYSNQNVVAVSNWVTVPVSAMQTSVAITANFWDDNGINKSWSNNVTIPAY